MSCWSHINVQLINDYETKIYDHNFFREDLGDKNCISRKRTIQKDG